MASRYLVWSALIVAALVVLAAAMFMLRSAAEQPLASAPGSALPSGEECASAIDRSGWEPIPENAEANEHVPDDVSIPALEGYDERATEEFGSRVDGDFTGTTDEIIAWGACKWGVDADLVRAQAYAESSWLQSSTGDHSDDAEECIPGDEPPCPTSFGLLQIKHLFHPGTYPHSHTSTAFNVDYGLALMRACYEGWVEFFPEDYHEGDFEGCLGVHFSGNWRDELGLDYIDRVMDAYENAKWQELPNYPG